MRRDSSVTQTAFTISTRQLGSQASVQGTLDQFTATGGNLPPVEPLPVPFSGTFRGGGLAIDSVRGERLPSVLTCESPALSRLSVVRRNLFVAPATLSRNQSWTDSSTVPACSGTIPVQVTSVRTYKVIGEVDGRILVERQDRVVASGEGAQGQHRVTIHSRGTGSSRLYIDQMTGGLATATGVSQVEVDIGSSGRLQRFVQVVRDRVTLR